jgi:flagellar assembly protein FliH
MGRILTRPETAGAPPVTRDWRACATRMDGTVTGRSQAATILLHARAQARAIIADAQVTAQAVAAAERQQAWESGYAEGLVQAQREGAFLVQRLSALVAGAAQAHEESVRNMDEEVLALVMALTREIVRREVATVPETILQVARAALDELSVTTSVVLRVHPDDQAIVQEQLPALGLAPSVQVAVVADEGIAPGGLLVESGAGRVDGTLDARLQRIEALLQEGLHAA